MSRGRDTSPSTFRIRRRTVVVSLLALGLVVWFLRGANLTEVWHAIGQARWSLLLLSLVFIGASFVARAVRWHYLLAPVGHASFRSIFRTTIIGFGALGLLPVRVGDVVRPYLLARREGLSLTATLATVVMERVLDLVAVLVLLALYVWGFGGRAAMPDRWLRAIEPLSAAFGVGALVLLAVMWVLATHPERVGALAALAVRALPGRLSERVGAIATTFSTGFAATRDRRALAMAVFWSFPVWTTIAGQAWAATAAFGIDMPFSGAFLLQSLLVLGVAVPTPGGVGSFHEAYRIGVTTFFGAGSAQAVAAAIVTHAVAYVPVVLLGVLFMAQDGLSLGGLRGLAGSAPAGRMGAPAERMGAP